MNTKTVIFTLILALCWCSAALAQGDDRPTPGALTLADEQGKLPLGLYLEILEDPSGELTIEEVRSPAFDDQFTPSLAEVPNFGFSDSAYWVRFHLENANHERNEWLLEAGFPNMQFVDLYSPMPDGGYAVKQTGSLRPPSSREIYHPRLLFNLNVPAESQRTFYLRFKNGAAMALPLTLWKPDAFLVESQRDQVEQGIFFGALLTLLAYNLFLFVSLRERNYLYLAAILAGMVVFEAGYTSYLELYLFPPIYRLKQYYQSISFSIVFVSMVLFADAFLELKIRLPKLHTLAVVIVGVWGVLLLLVPFVSYRTAASLMLPWTLPTLAAILVAGGISWWRGFHPARFFMIAWSGLVFAFIISILTRLGVISSTAFGESAYHLGLIWMAVCWSIALADRINLLKAETEKANLALRASETRLSQILEGMPMGVVVYGQDQRPTYFNRRIAEIFGNPARDIGPDLSAGRTLAQAIEYYAARIAGSDQAYPMANLPIYRALLGESASVDDVEINLVDRQVPLEIWANPVKDDQGGVQGAVVAIQDISRRKTTEARMLEYRDHLEKLVAQRTAERKMLADAQANLAEWLSTVSRVQPSLKNESDLPLAFEELLSTILRLSNADAVFSWTWDDQNGPSEVLCYVRSNGAPARRKVAPIALSKIGSLRGEVGQKGLVVMAASDAVQALEPLGVCLESARIQSVALVPIAAESETTGLLGLALPVGADAFSEEEIFLLGRMGVDLATVAGYARLHESVALLAAAEERNRLARDLHDSVSQVLFSATLVASVLPKIWRKDPARAFQSLENLRRLTNSGLAELRTMLLELRPSAVLNTPLSELLAQLTEAITSRTSLPFQLFLEQTPPLPEAVHTAFYRIAQESLNNVVKHAQAGHVAVSLNSTKIEAEADGSDRYQVTLEVRDNGVGY
ncbi:MAG: PAS domain-containing protein, partial [Caldilineaceae bacterium]|nr:PAS domain-containing protein [Caldilineaceae bacterium]